MSFPGSRHLPWFLLYLVAAYILVYFSLQIPFEGLFLLTLLLLLPASMLVALAPQGHVSIVLLLVPLINLPIWWLTRRAVEWVRSER